MPQIPTLPIDEPVALQRAKPAIYGSGGDTIAELGQQTANLAQSNMAFEGHLIYAQRQLKAKEAEIAIDKYMNQVYADLNKTTTVEDAQAVMEQAQSPQQVAPLLAPYEKDPRLGQMVTMAWQQAQVHLQSAVNEHKARIIVQGTHAADAVNEDKTEQQAIGVGAVGDDYKIFRDRYEMSLRAGEAAGVYPPQVVDQKLAKWDQEVEKGIAVAGYNSDDPAKRQYTIKQLEDGKAFPHLDKATLSALRVAAESRDRELTNLSEWRNLNTALNAVHNDFQKPPFKDNYDLQLDALDDTQWLKDHGIVTPKGEPDRVMAAKLAEDINRQRVYHDRAQKEHDEGILEKYSPMIDAHKLSIPQIDSLMQTEGASSRAVGALKSMWYREQREARAEARFAKAEARSERQEKRQELQERSDQTSLDLWQRIEKGETIDLTSDVYEQVGKGNLTKGQAATIVQGYKRSKQSEDFGYGLGVIDKSPLDNVTKVKIKDQFTKRVHEESTKPEDMPKVAQQLVDEAGHKATGNFINRLWQNLSHGPAAAPSTPVPPARPKGVPDGAVWNPETKTWQLQQ